VSFIDTDVLVYAAADGAPLLDRARRFGASSG
jgi:hypothetical protein